MSTRLKPASLLVAALAVAAIACSDDDGVTPTRTPKFEIVPEKTPLALTQDDSLQFGTTLYDRANGTVMSSRTGMTVTSANPAVLVVRNSANSVIKALAGGSTTLSFKYTDPVSKESATLDIPVTVTPVAVGSVVFTSSDPTLFADEKVKVRAVALSAAKDSLPRRALAYTVDAADTAVAAVAADGTVTPKDAGVAHVIAAVEGRADTTVITVQNRPVTRVTLTPTLSTIKVGATVKLTATVNGTKTAPNDVTITNRVPTWTSSDPAVATVDGKGSVTGVAAPAGGALVTITATVDSQSASAQVVVNP
ncbi:MAG: Ig domain-containing protein [Gemmatimonadaceae bacterium]